MNTKSTKFLAVLAVLAMAFAVVAIVAPADDADADATSVTTYAGLTTAVGNGGEIKLGANIAVTDTVSVAKAVVLDLNGYVLYGSELASKAVISITSAGSLTVKDSNASAAHKFTASDNGWTSIKTWTYSNPEAGDVTVNGGIITGGTAGAITNAGVLTIQAGTIVGNSATNGGAIYNSKTLNISGGVIEHNTASNGAGVYNTADGTITMTGGKITENFRNTGSGWNGGGVYNAGTFTFSAGEVSKNFAALGGGVYNAGTFTMSGNAVISGNNCSNGVGGDGFGLYVNTAGKTDLNGGSITGNGTEFGEGSYGIGMYIESGAVTIDGAKISGNIGGGDNTAGAGVYIAGGSLTLKTGEISGNKVYTEDQVKTKELSPTHAWFVGGGVFVGEGTTFTMSGGKISENKSPAAGGVFVRGTFNLSGGEISKNVADNGAGVMVGIKVSDTVYAGTFTMTGGVITENASKEYGNANHGHCGAGVQTYGTFTMSAGEISKNVAGDVSHTSNSSGGAGIAVAAGTTTISGTAVIKENVANFNGAGVSVSEPGKFIMNGGEISNNTAGANMGVAKDAGGVTGKYGTGGGIWTCSTEEVGVLITAGTIKDNTALGNNITRNENGGANIYVRQGTVKITGGTVSGGTVADVGVGTTIFNRGTLVFENAFVNNGSIYSLGNVSFTEADSKKISEIGLQGTGSLEMVSGKLTMVQGSSGTEQNILASGENTIIINHGATMVVAEASSANQWGIVGGTVASTFANLCAANPTEYIFATTTEASVAITATLSGGILQGTTYATNGNVSIGISNGDLKNDYFGRADVIHVVSGITTFTVDTTLGANVNLKVAEDGSYAAKAKLEGGSIKTDDGRTVDNVTELDGGETIADVIKKNDDKKEDTNVTTSAAIATSIQNNAIAITDSTVKFVSGEAAQDLTVKEITVSTDAEVSFSGFNTVSGVIKTTDGTTTQTVELKNVKGTLTITKGSVIIDGKEVSGEVQLDADVEVKLSGTINGGNFTISMKDETKTATVIIEADKSVVIETAHSLIIKKGVTLKVYGTITNKAGIAATLEIQADAALFVMSGGKIANVAGGTSMTVTGKGTAYSGSDINTATITPASWTGKDENGGKWTVKTVTTVTPATTKHTLILDGYNGTWNFTSFADDIVSIVINGDNEVTYNVPETFTAADVIIGATYGIKKIETDKAGSLDLIIDYSKASKDAINGVNTIIKASADEGLTIDKVDLTITAKGSNDTWVNAKGKYDVKIDAITGGAKGIKVEDALLTINMMDAIASDNVYAIQTTGAVSVSNSSLEIVSAGFGIKAAAVTISNSLVDITANKNSLLTTTAGVEISNCLAVEITGTIKTNTSVSIKNCTAVTTGAIDAKTTAEIKQTTIQIKGTFDAETSVTINSASTVKVTKAITTPTLIVKLESDLEVKGLNLSGIDPAKSTIDNSIVTITGDSIITGELVNNSELVNKGLMGVYGTLTNSKDAIFTNEGTVNLYKYESVDNTYGLALDAADNATAVGNVKFASLTFAGAGKTVNNADGTATFKDVVVRFYSSTGALITPEYEKEDLTMAEEKFTATLTLDLDGYYTLTLTGKTCTITITYSKITSPEAKFGKSYAISVTGNILDHEKTVYYLEQNKTGDGAVALTDNIAKTKVFNDSGATFTNAGTVNNNSAFTISAGETATIGGKYNGPLTTNTPATVISGTFKGDLTANLGTVTINAEKSLTGDITAKGLVTVNDKATVTGDITTDAGVTSTGAIVGDITAKGAVSVKDLEGDITVNANGNINVTVAGKMVGDLIYNSKYKATKEAKAGEETTYTAKMHIDGESTGVGFIIVLAAGSDATDSKAVVPGFFKIGSMVDLADGKTVELTLTEGKFLVDSNVELKSRYSLVIEKGTTIEVNKAAASLNVKASALKVSKEATANFETGSAVSVNYGKVLFVMSFETADGYTMYSNVAYALINCDENSDLTVGENASIEQDVAIKAGVNVIAKDVILTFTGYSVEMGEGAKITIEGTGKVVFKESKDNKAEADADEKKEYDYESVDATIVFGDNTAVLDGVRFTNDSTFAGVAATASENAKISITALYNEGTIELSAGEGTGAITLTSNNHKILKADTEESMFFGTFTVGEGTIFEATAISDDFAVVDYEVKDTKVVIKQVDKMPTSVIVTGTLKLTNGATIKGVWAGGGDVVLANGKSVVLAASDAKPDAAAVNKTIPGSVTLTIVDKDGAGYALLLAEAKDNATLTIASEKFKTADVMTIAGDLGVGSIVGKDDAYLKGLMVEMDAAVTGEDVYVITADATAKGDVMAKNLYVKEGTGASDYMKLIYEVTFELGDYTVYTYFKNVDFDLVDEITLTDSKTLAELGIVETLDLTGKDVTIIVAEGKTLTLTQTLIIGTPATTLGEEGSAIVGKVVINNGFYLLAYADVDLEDAKICQAGGELAAVSTKMAIEDVLYATVFANEGNIQLANSVDKIKPEIEGYNFTKWVRMNDNPGVDRVGQTDVYAGTKAILVTVTVKFAEGVSYYLDGVEFAIYDVPTKVEYNSVFTAKINNTAKYEGTPLINGKNSFIVTEDATLTVTGVNPIPVPPEPTPEPVEENTGLTLTDILLIVLVVLIAIMVVILVLRLNRS